MNVKTAEARDLLEAELFHSDVDRLLRDALRMRYAGFHVWLQDTSDSEVVYEVSPDGDAPSTSFRATYAIDAANQVAIGDPVQVERKTIYVPVGQVDVTTEAEDFATGGEFVALVEKAVRRDGTMAIKVISPGRGSSGFYPAEVLERDGPKVFAKGTKVFVDHPTATESVERPERSVRDLAGEFISDARWEAQGSAGPGLYADAKVFAPWQPFVEELAPHIGMSIRAQGRAKMGDVEGAPMRIIEELVSAQSVDLVTAAGAGGQILSLFESARNRVAVELQPTYLEASMASDQELKEARDALAAAEVKLQEQSAAAVEKDTELARYREAAITNEARALAAETLATIDLPELTRARLTESAKPVLADGALDRTAFVVAVTEAAKQEAEYLAALSESGKVRHMGGAPAPEGGPVDVTAGLVESFRGMGYSEETAKSMAAGR